MTDIPGYRILRHLGQGGFGQVFLGERIQNPVLVAIKTCLPGADPNQHARFQDEIQLSKMVHSPYVPRFFGAGLTANREAYLVTEFIEGETLYQAASRLPRKKDRIALLKRVMPSVIQALKTIHALGAVHRDLKPENIMVRKLDGRGVLLDLGLAKADFLQPKTATGMILGSLAYMAPEQLTGQTKKYGPETDVYQLAMVIFRVMNGSFQDPDVHRYRSPDEVLGEVKEAKISPAAKEAFLKCFAPDPTKRIDVGFPDLGVVLREDEKPERLQLPIISVKREDTERPKPSKIGTFLIIAVAFATGSLVTETSLGKKGVAQTNARERAKPFNPTNEDPNHKPDLLALETIWKTKNGNFYANHSAIYEGDWRPMTHASQLLGPKLQAFDYAIGFSPETFFGAKDYLVENQVQRAAFLEISGIDPFFPFSNSSQSQIEFSTAWSSNLPRISEKETVSSLLKIARRSSESSLKAKIMNQSSPTRDTRNKLRDNLMKSLFDWALVLEAADETFGEEAEKFIGSIYGDLSDLDLPYTFRRSYSFSKPSSLRFDPYICLAYSKSERFPTDVCNRTLIRKLVNPVDKAWLSIFQDIAKRSELTILIENLDFQ